MTAIEAPPRRWDAVVKLTHWSIVAAVLANAVLVRNGSATHIWIGYALAAVLALRLVWGVVGPREARFTSFPPSLSAGVQHVGDIVAGRRRAHPSHNPLGALMVYAIWGVLGVVIASGIAMAGVPALPGTLPAPATYSLAWADGESDDDEDGASGDTEEGPLAEVHEAAVNLLYLLIVLHIAGVIFETRRSGRHVVMAMLPRSR